MATLKVELRTLIFFSPSNAPRFVTCNLSSAKTAGTEPSELRRPCVVPLERAFPALPFFACRVECPAEAPSPRASSWCRFAICTCKWCSLCLACLRWSLGERKEKPETALSHFALLLAWTRQRSVTSLPGRVATFAPSVESRAEKQK